MSPNPICGPQPYVRSITQRGLLAALLIALLTSCHKPHSITLRGAVIRQDADTRKQLPVSGVEVSAADGMSMGAVKSDAAGYFALILKPGIKPGEPVVLTFRHAEYEPLDATAFGGELYIARMVPTHQDVPVETNHPAVKVSNIRLRYTVKTPNTVDVGSGVKTFQVVNTANVLCNGRAPCSPDGKWKASIGFTTLDAGEGNEFRNARVSCIAGPCPFTKIESDGFSRGGRNISVSARNWSDTATFLVEAEVVRAMVSDLVRDSYPVIFGQALNFSLPPAADGPSIEAEINGEAIIFPLGPNLCLSWADCNLRVDRDGTRAYRCELKPGYRF